MTATIQTTTISEKLRSASRFAVLSIAALSFAASISVAHADELVGKERGHIGNEFEPGNSGAALSEEGNGQTACAGQILSYLASNNNGIGFEDPPTTTVDLIDLLFYVGDLVGSDVDCAKFVSG